MKTQNQLKHKYGAYNSGYKDCIEDCIKEILKWEELSIPCGTCKVEHDDPKEWCIDINRLIKRIKPVMMHLEEGEE